MVVEAGFTPNGEQFAEGYETEQPGSDLVSRSFDAETLEAQLYEMVERQRAQRASNGLYFNPSHYMYGQLLFRSVDLFDGQVHDGVTVEGAKLLAGRMALAIGILGYPQWRPEDQMSFRKRLQTLRYIQYCEIEQSQWEREGYIDWDRADEHDHYIKLPETGRQLLKHITNVVDVPYNPQQDTFYFSTVLNQPEPVLPEGQ